MSGRKSTEVNGLLSRGKDARKAGNENYLKNISASEKSLRDNQKKITDATMIHTEKSGCSQTPSSCALQLLNFTSKCLWCFLVSW